MAETQHDGFSAFVAPGNNQVVLSHANGDGAVVGNPNIELYELKGALTFTMGAITSDNRRCRGQTRPSRPGAIETVKGSLAGGSGGSDTLVLDDGDNVSGATFPASRTSRSRAVPRL